MHVEPAASAVQGMEPSHLHTNGREMKSACSFRSTPQLACALNRCALAAGPVNKHAEPVSSNSRCRSCCAFICACCRHNSVQAALHTYQQAAHCDPGRCIGHSGRCIGPRHRHSENTCRAVPLAIAPKQQASRQSTCRLTCPTSVAIWGSWTLMAMPVAAGGQWLAIGGTRSSMQ